jgi:hypothetical protein
MAKNLLKSFLSDEQQDKYAHFAISSQHSIEIFSRATREEKEIKDIQIGKKENDIYLQMT